MLKPIIALLATVAMTGLAQTVSAAQIKVPDNQCNVRNYGAEATGIWYDTPAFQKAIDDCASKGGGTVIVPAGYYLSAPLFLASNIRLDVQKGAVIQASGEESYYHPTAETQKWAGVPKLWPNAEKWLAFLNIADAENVAITGEGVIDGQGAILLESWRANARKTGSKGSTNRPRLVFIKNASNVLIEGITLQNSPSFHVVFYNTEDITINKTTITAPDWWQNTDAIDPMHSRKVRITNNTLSVGDDHIAIKSVFKDDNTHDFYIAGNTFLSGRGLSVGSESSGGVRNIVAENNTFKGSMYGIRIKSPRGVGGLVKDVVYRNTTMVDVKTPIVLSGYYKGAPANAEARNKALTEGEFAGGFMLGDQIYPADTEAAKPFDVNKTPHFDNIVFENLTSTGKSEQAAYIIGTPEKPFTNVQFKKVNITAERGIQIRNASVTAKGIKITARNGKPVLLEKSGELSGK